MKKYISLFLCFVSIFLLSSCKKADRFDISELSLRLGEVNESYSFDYENIFYSDEIYYIYYSFFEENDMLLTAMEDEDGNLIRVSLGIWETADEVSVAAYKDFCQALTDVFVSEKERKGLVEETGLFGDGVLFGDYLSVCEKTNYTARAFSSEFGAVYVLNFNMRE